MKYIIIPNYNEKLIANIEYIFLNSKITIIYSNKINEYIYNENIQSFIFINNFIHPIKYFVSKIDTIISNFTYLSDTNDIFFVNKKNITFCDNILNIKRTNDRIILFNSKSNLYDYIIPPDDVNKDYNILLKAFIKSYDLSINFNIAFKSYEKFLKYIVKTSFCYNFIVYITDINQLDIKLPKYMFYRLTILHNLKNDDDIRYINTFCKKNKILMCVYINNNLLRIFNIISSRSIWFEKIVFIKNINLLNDELLCKLNKYNKNYNNLILDSILVIETSDFVLMPYNLNKNIELKFNDIYKLIENYIIDNCQSIYNPLNKENKYQLKFKNLDTIFENQLMNIRDYNKLIINIDNKIKKNYDNKERFNLLIKKISLGTLCKPDKEIINEIDLVVQAISNLDFLTSLVILFSNIRNPVIMNKLYIKILKQSQENQLSPITFKCFQSLLSVNMDEETMNTVLDFITLINKDELCNKLDFDKVKLKQLMIKLFLSASKFIEKPEIIEKFNKVVNNVFDMSDIMNIDKILSINPNSDTICILHFLIFLTTNMSAYYPSINDFIDKRNEIKNNINYLLNKDLPICKLNDVVIIPVCNFYLSYQGIPSVEIFKIKSQLIRKICPEINYKINTDFTNNKINICFHSNYLNRWHSVFKDRHQIIRAMADDPDFNVYFTTFDDLQEDVKYLFGKAKHIKLHQTLLEEMKKTLVDLKLDVLVYCEIGMDPKSYFLAHMKLAKIQINTWGHSDSSGIDTIDYFFSSKYYELPYDDAQTHYSEKLILLDSLCTSYVNPSSRYNINTFKNRYEYGFTDEVVIFFCAQSLFKFNPIFDDYIIRILNANKNFVLVILNNESKQKVIERYNNQNITSRIHIFPMMQHNQYMNLINISDVILDPYPFGGCNSSFEAFSLNKVIVTHASDMINGRFTSGFYKKMELENMITYNKDDYIKLAIKLGTNINYRKSIENKIKEKQLTLFNEKNSIDSWINTIKNITKI